MPYFTPPKDINYVNSLWFNYIVSATSASVAETCTFPFDLTKTRLQIQGELANKGDVKAKSLPYRGMFLTAVGIAKEEGILKLWQGLSAALVRQIVYSGLRIPVYKIFKEEVFHTKSGEHFPLSQSAICATFSGVFSQFVANPADLIKVQLQMEGKRRVMGYPPRVHGLFDAFSKIVKVSGYRGLWKGSIPNMQRAALVTLGDLTTYDLSKRFLIENTSLKDDYKTHTLASFLAGLVAALLGNPADVVKTRVMNQQVGKDGRGLVYSSSLDCLRKTVANEGFFALYKGFFPIWIRMAPWSLIFWVTYEKIMHIIGANPF